MKRTRKNVTGRHTAASAFEQYIVSKADDNYQKKCDHYQNYTKIGICELSLFTSLVPPLFSCIDR